MFSQILYFIHTCRHLQHHYYSSLCSLSTFSVLSSMYHLNTSKIKALTMIFHHISTYQRCCRHYWQYLDLHLYMQYRVEYSATCQPYHTAVELVQGQQKPGVTVFLLFVISLLPVFKIKYFILTKQILILILMQTSLL